MKEIFRDEEVLRYIDEHLHEPDLFSESIARHCGLSERAIKRIVRSSGTDVSFAAFLQEKRMLLIAHLLTETHLPISEICEHAGYATPSAFYKAFKRVYGVTPSEFRNEKQPR